MAEFRVVTPKYDVVKYAACARPEIDFDLALPHQSARNHGFGMFMDVVDNDVLSSIIGDIYDCVLNREGWSSVLTRITQTMDAAYTTIAFAGTCLLYTSDAADE